MGQLTKIRVVECDNELTVKAAQFGQSVQLFNLKSGFGTFTEFACVPSAFVVTGDYTLVLIGENYGGPQKFKVILTIDGADVEYLSPDSTKVGVSWEQSIPVSI